MVIIEPTSGNTGIALAFVCAAKGYDLVLTLPQGMSRERESLLRLYGARVQITESLGGMGEAVEAARAMAREQDVFLPDQFSNPANPEVHRRTTGPEIEQALDGRIDVLVAGVGTGGTITGAGEYLREHANLESLLTMTWFIFRELAAKNPNQGERKNAGDHKHHCVPGNRILGRVLTEDRFRRRVEYLNCGELVTKEREPGNS